MTGHDHKNLIAGNDPEFAADTIVMEEVTTGVGDTCTVDKVYVTRRLG